MTKRQDTAFLAESDLLMLPVGITDAVFRHMYPEPSPYKHDAAGWIQDRLGAFIWSKQVEICKSLDTFRYTGVKACHGPGKSYTAARLACFWLDPAIHALGTAFVVTTAPTWAQVQAILWREIRRAHRQAQLPGRITLDCHWYMGEGKHDEELIAMGRKPADYDEQAFQGLHAEHILVILDEASGIPSQLWIAVETLMTNEHARMLAIGNPDDPGSDFANKCKKWEKMDGANVIRINAFDTPNFTGEYVPENVAAALVTEQWVNDRREDWGEDSMLWTAKVLGEFPDLSDDYLITPSMIARSYETNLAGLDHGRYGVDIAHMGQDKSEMYRNRGGQIRHVKTWAKKNTVQSAGEVAAVLDSHHFVQVPAVIDGIGVGAGVYDTLFAQGHEVGAFIASQRALNPIKFYNRRAEEYWKLREEMDLGLVDLDPKDEVLASQLTSVKYWINMRGQIQIETKDDMRDRGLPSPDKADAVIMSRVFLGLKERIDPDSLKTSNTADLLERVM